MNLQRVLVGVDFSPESDLAILHGLALAVRKGARLILAHVLPLPTDLVEDSPYDPLFRAQGNVQLGAMHRDRASDLLLEEKAQCEESGVEVETVLVDDNPSDGLARVADELAADLLVVGTHGRTGLKRFLLGSVAERAVRLARTDALVARGPSPDGNDYRCILVATDFSPAADAALSAALSIAPPDARIELVHCWQIPVVADDLPPEPLRSELAASVSRRGERLLAERDDARGRVSFVAVEFSPAEGLRQRAEETGCDLIVVGSHGRRGVRRLLLGSVAETVVRHSPCSVLVVHPSGPQAAD